MKISNDEDYKIALNFIEKHFDCWMPRGTPLGDQFNIYMDAVMEYESEYFPITLDGI